MAHCECDDAAIGLHDPSGCEYIGMRVRTAHDEIGTIVDVTSRYGYVNVRTDRGPLYLSLLRDLTFLRA